MPRHKQDQRTARLLGEMEETRSDCNAVVAGLVASGVRKAEIARAAEWNAGYLGDFLENPSKRPTSRKIEALIAALDPFVRQSTNAGVGAGFARLSKRYEANLSAPSNPTAGPIPVSSPNYIARTDVERVLERHCETPGDFAVDGQPMVGISSVLLYVESKLRERGYDVRRLSAGTDLLASRYGREREELKTGMLGLLAAALTGSEAPLELDFFRVQERLRDYLIDLDGPFALIIDDVNQLEIEEVEALKLMMRDWSTRRAAGEHPYRNVTIWVAMTSNVRSARRISNFLSCYTVLRWFEREEVRTLAAALAPYSPARGESRKWTTQVADSAWSLFHGQPHLTHLFLWDRHADGSTDVPADLAKTPVGAYKRHVDTIARSLKNLLGASTILAFLEHLRSDAPAVSQSDLASAESLGIIDSQGGWSCDYYKMHMPHAIEVLAGR